MSPPNCVDSSSMFSLDLLALSEPAHLNINPTDCEWAASTAQANASPTIERATQAQARSAPAHSNSSGCAVEPLDNILPAKRGLHFLTLLSKGRPPVEPRSAASANADTACQRSSVQAQTDAQPVDKVVVLREKNKRAQKRHRDRIRVRHALTGLAACHLLAWSNESKNHLYVPLRLYPILFVINHPRCIIHCLQAREEQTSQQIAVLTAELKKSQREKGLIEQRAHTLSTALAYRTDSSSEVHTLSPTLVYALAATK